MFEEIRKGTWYEGMEVVKHGVIEGNGVAYDLVAYDTTFFGNDFDEETEVREYQREYQIYRLFTIGDRVQLSVDFKYTTPVFQNQREAIQEYQKIETFIEEMIQRGFCL